MVNGGGGAKRSKKTCRCQVVQTGLRLRWLVSPGRSGWQQRHLGPGRCLGIGDCHSPSNFRWDFSNPKWGSDDGDLMEKGENYHGFSSFFCDLMVI